MPLDLHVPLEVDLQSDLFASLLTRREQVLTSIRDLEDELDDLNALITRYQMRASKGKLKSTQPLRQVKPKQTRVRGVLAAARKAIEQLPEPFDKNQLLAKLVEIDEEFAHKKISGANIRNALRLLTQDGVIRVENSATATTCAKYVRAP